MPEIEARLVQIEAKLDEVRKTTRRVYQIFLWTAIVTALAVILPLVFAVLALPSLMSSLSSYGEAYQGVL